MTTNPERLPLREPIALSTGRTIAFHHLPNGAQDAVPTTGPRALTEEESEEMHRVLADRNRPALSTEARSLVDTPCARGCDHPHGQELCPHAVVEIHGRWWITAGHRGFNGRTNNSRGFKGPRAARRSIAATGGSK